MSSMQVYAPFIIELIFRDTNETYKISAFRPYDVEPYIVLTYASMKQSHGKPIGFKFNKLNVPINSIKFINWLQHDFKSMFDYDPLLWLASVATVPVELHQYLIPFHKEL